MGDEDSAASSPPAGVSSQDSAPRDGRQSFVLFSFLWGLYGLLHFLITYWSWFQFSRPVELVLGAATLGATGWLVLRPASLRRLVMALVPWTLYELHLLPEVANHLFLTVMVNLTLLLGIGYWWASEGRHRREGSGRYAAWESLYRQLGPLLRLELLTLYFFAVLHKLNWDFFNPEVSCGWILYVQMVDALGLPLQADWMRWPGIVGALAMEALIPVLLMVPRTRVAGIVVGLGFHLMLAIHPNIFIASFTSMLFALYAVFLPQEMAARLFQRGRDAAVRFRRPAIVIVVAAGVVGAAVSVRFVVVTDRLNRDGLIEALHILAPPVIRYLWAGVVLFCYGALLYEIYTHRRLARPRATVVDLLMPRWTPATLITVLVFMNGFSPYLGLKTQSAYSMFSNLRTEFEASNHLFIPTWLQVADYQKHVVELVRSSDSHLNGVAAAGQWLPFVEVRRRAGRSRDEGFTVTYRDAGREVVVSR